MKRPKRDPNGFSVDMEAATKGNSYFRKVLYTGPNAQLTVMSLKPGEDIGMETHNGLDQFIRLDGGSGKAIIDGKEYPLKNGSAIIIPSGSEHDVVAGPDGMKLYSVYTKQNHPDMVIDKTKEDATKREESEMQKSSDDLLKAKKMAIGTVSRGYKKVAEGKWVKVKQESAQDEGQDRESYSTSDSSETSKKKVEYPKGYIEASEFLGFGGGKIDFKKITPQDAGKALGNSHGMPKSLYDKLRFVESKGRSVKKTKNKKRFKKSITTLAIIPGSLSKAVKPTLGTSAVRTNIKGDPLTAGHEERMKLAKMAAFRMAKPECTSAYEGVSKVSQKGKEAGGKAPTTPKTGGVSGMGSQASDMFGLTTYIVKPSELGSSVPEPTSKNGKIRSITHA